MSKRSNAEKAQELLRSEVANVRSKIEKALKEEVAFFFNWTPDSDEGHGDLVIKNKSNGDAINIDRLDSHLVGLLAGIETDINASLNEIDSSGDYSFTVA